MTLKAFEETVGMVTQRIYIFHDTIAANVAYGKEIDEQKLSKHSKKQMLTILSVNLKGIYTHLNEFGANLSGGQRQRIAITERFMPIPKSSFLMRQLLHSILEVSKKSQMPLKISSKIK